MADDCQRHAWTGRPHAHTMVRNSVNWASDTGMDNDQAWSAYWAEKGATGNCLPGAPDHVAERLANHWREFAATLAKGASCLDLATGSGAVLRLIRAQRSDLLLAGIDYAELPESADPDVTLIGRTDMAALPFDDDSFDAFVSQFGFEYGTHGEIVAELVRVSRPGSLFQLIMHHRSSPVVAQNRTRAAALDAIGQSDALVRAAEGDASGVIAALDPVFDEHGDQPVVAEIAAALRDIAGRSGREAEKDLDWVASGMARERALLRHLSESALDEDSAARISALFAGSGFIVEHRAPIPGDENGPIAWLVNGRRAD